MSSIMRPDFSYEPLVEPNAIRLVHLYPAYDVTAQLECSIEYTTLSKCDEDLVDHYTALSYVWGDPTYVRPIIVDGFVFKITANLDSAMRHLRDRNRVMRVWADAICINQNDLKERSQQVQQMGSVYSVARHTVIYLGDSSEKEGNAFSELKSLCANSFYSKFAMDELLNNASVDLGVTHDALEKQILNRPWFTRVWIFQELLLSRDPWVQCGTKRLKWSILCQFSFAIRDRVRSKLDYLPKPNPDDESSIKRGGLSTANSLKLPGAISRLEYMQLARQKFQSYLQGHGTGNTLLTVLSFRRGMGASDPRDMIFAHFGLASDSTSKDLRFEVDYSKSLAQVFVDAARFILNQKHQYYQYGLLAQVEDVDPKTRRHDLPSWIPDWTLNKIQHQLTHDHHEPTDHWNLPSSFSFGMSSEGRYQLHCEGRIYGRVGDIGKNVLRFAHMSQDEIRQAWWPHLIEMPPDSDQKWYEMIEEELQKAVGLQEFSKHSNRFREILGYARLRLPDQHPVALALSKPFTASYSQANLQALEGKRICQVVPVDPHMRPYWSEFALMPQWTKLGDLICSLHGDSRLFVLRRANRLELLGSDQVGDCFSFIGVCYAVRLYWVSRIHEAGVERMFTLE